MVGNVAMNGGLYHVHRGDDVGRVNAGALNGVADDDGGFVDDDIGGVHYWC